MMKQVNYRSIQLLFYSLMLGQLLFAGVAWWLNAGMEPAGSSLDGADFAIAVPGLLLGGFLAAYLIDKNRAGNAPVQAELPEKLNHYRTSVVIRAALMEAPNLVSLVAYLLTEENIYMVYFALGLAAFFMFRPTTGQFQQRYQVSRQQMEEMV